jgi:hypothetical protein
VAKQFEPLIFTDRSAFSEVAGFKRSEIISTIRSQAVTEELRPSGVKGIFLMEDRTLFGLRRFLELTKMSFAPGDAGLVYDSFLLGAVKTPVTAEDADGTGFFMLLQAKTTADIFTPLRKWEGKMFYDLYEIFGFKVGSEKSYLLTEKFKDSLVENKNARILTDRDGKLLLFYVFADNNSVIISDSLHATREVMLHLASKETKE